MHNGETDVEAEAVYHPEKTQASKQEKDPNIVYWDGEDDPEKALNWSSRRKWAYIIMLATLTLLTCADPQFFPCLLQPDLQSLQALLLVNVRTRHPSCHVGIQFDQ